MPPWTPPVPASALARRKRCQEGRLTIENGTIHFASYCGDECNVLVTTVMSNRESGAPRTGAAHGAPECPRRLAWVCGAGGGSGRGWTAWAVWTIQTPPRPRRRRARSPESVVPLSIPGPESPIRVPSCDSWATPPPFPPHPCGPQAILPPSGCHRSLFPHAKHHSYLDTARAMSTVGLTAGGWGSCF